MNECIAVVGIAASGKTNWIINYIMNTKSVYKRIVIYARDDESLYTQLIKLYPSIEFHMFYPSESHPKFINIDNLKTLIVVDDEGYYRPSCPYILESIPKQSNITTIFTAHLPDNIPKSICQHVTQIIRAHIGSTHHLQMLHKMCPNIEIIHCENYFK